MTQLQQAPKPQPLEKILLDPRKFISGFSFVGAIELEAKNLLLRRKACSELLSAFIFEKRRGQNRVSPLEGFGLALDGNG
jgi:hypothetical protein